MQYIRNKSDMNNDFRKFAVNHLGINSNTLDGYTRHIEKQGAIFTSTTPSADYMNPYILEERQLNVTQMDVFSRLMMDRIIFLGTQVSDTSANIIQAQLLYLDSIDPDKDISIYINSPGGSVYAGLGIYDTMQYISSDVLQSAQAWQPLWRLCCSWQERRGNAMPSLIPA